MGINSTFSADLSINRVLPAGLLSRGGDPCAQDSVVHVHHLRLPPRWIPSARVMGNNLSYFILFFIVTRLMHSLVRAEGARFPSFSKGRMIEI